GLALPASEIDAQNVEKAALLQGRCESVRETRASVNIDEAPPRPALTRETRTVYFDTQTQRLDRDFLGWDER
ncbi:MAG TPA: hypothetical protein VGP07_24940, partial [Polyangia bacterium]